MAVFATSSDAQRIATGNFAAGATASVRLRFDNWLAPGRYGSWRRSRVRVLAPTSSTLT